ncbi:BTAD domain-containing putative transcriptional regulator [Longispora sp. NPDC051575]|uniref:AfsR/SARP family transcriptional regulator n=1 Tax=Longispora sp. NPDC051575 TaxID=3154943 RepID=UPI003413DC3E
MTLRFGLLGPVQVLVDDRPVADLAPRHRAVLCCLLLHARRTVSSERLINAIWGDTPPDRARGQIQVAVSALRRTLRDAGAEHLLQTRSAGYVLDVTPEQFDVDAFAALAASPDDAAALRGALALWRGPALADVSAPYVEAARARLEDQRLAVVERLAELDLAAGRTALVVDELTGWTAEHPLRERLRRHLMLALYRLDRQADALAVARDYRALLAEEHGLDPGKEFVDLERAILTDDPALRPAPAAALRPAGPAQLPPDVPDFVGRVGETARLDELFDGAGAVVISTIEGAGGVGKTALALHWAHRVRDLYPDGQLYVNLHGYSATEPVRPLDALTGFLRALGVPGEEIPVDLAEATAAYRTLLADRRVLVILDNASGPDQVRPLLPGSRSSRVVVTSRDRLAGLIARDGARLLELGVLPPDKAVELLTRILGRRRVVDELDAVAELAGLCGGLPLALRIAAAHLVSQPGRDIADYNAELRAGDLLASLEVPGDALASVRVVFGRSYRALAPGHARLFRLVGLLPGADVTADAAAALAEIPADRAAELLGALAAAHLLETDGHGRYAPHDLIRVYARHRAEAEDSAEDRAAAVRRLAGWALSRSDAAARSLYPQLLRLEVDGAGPAAAPAEANAWLDAERANLVAIVRHCAEHGPLREAWLLASTLRGYFYLGRHLADWLSTATAAVTSADAAGDHAASAAGELSLGHAHQTAANFDTATAHYNRVLAVAPKAGWSAAEAAAEGNLGNILWSSGRLEEASEHLTRAVDAGRRMGSLPAQANNLGNLGNVYADLGRLREAADHHQRALGLFRDMGAEGGEAHGLHNVGWCHLHMGDFEKALEYTEASAVLFHRLGDQYESAAHYNASEACRELGRIGDARRHADQALEIARAAGDRRLEVGALSAVGEVARLSGRPGEAVALQERAAELGRETDSPEPEARALLWLADACVSLAEVGRARAVVELARKLAVQHNFMRQLCDAHTRLAELDLAAGDRAAAGEHARRAVAIRERTGYRLGEARTFAVLALTG